MLQLKTWVTSPLQKIDKKDLSHLHEVKKTFRLHDNAFPISYYITAFMKS